MAEGRQRQRRARNERAALFLRLRRSGMTFAAIGEAYGLSGSRVRDLVHVAEQNEALNRQTTNDNHAS